MKNTNKEELENWYLVERLSTRAIAKKLEVSQPTARKIMKEFDIPMRTYKDNITPAMNGYVLTEKDRAKISKALKGNTNFLNKETGKHVNFQQEEVPCDYCGKLVSKKQVHLKAFKNFFCNLVCHGLWKSENLPKGAGHPNYHREIKKCDWCGESVVRGRAEAGRSENFFCNPQCNGLWKAEHLRGEKLYNWKGGYKGYYGQNWLQQRRAALQRDSHTCQRCGKTNEDLGRNPDVHHIKPFREFGVKNYLDANELSNLICYCNSCHKIVEESQ